MTFDLMILSLMFLTLVYVQSITTLIILKVVLDIRREKIATPNEPKGLPRPDKLTIINITGGSMDKYTYKMSLPELGADDVVKREMHVMVNGETTVYEIDVTATEWDLVLEEDSECKIWMVDIDDADNRSPDGLILEFVVTDIVPPNAPQAPTVLTVEVFKEEVIEDGESA